MQHNPFKHPQFPPNVILRGSAVEGTAITLLRSVKVRAIPTTEHGHIHGKHNGVTSDIRLIQGIFGLDAKSAVGIKTISA